KNLLSTAFGLGALIAWSRWLREGGAARYAMSLLLFATALLSKSAWAVLPLVMLAMAGLIYRTSWRRTLALIMPHVALAAGATLVTAIFEHLFDQHDIPSIGQRLLIAPGALLFYVLRCAVPAG